MYNRVGHGHPVFGQSACLIGAKDINSGEFFNRNKPAYNRLLSRQIHRPYCHSYGQNRRQRYGDSSNGQNQSESQNLYHVLLPKHGRNQDNDREEYGDQNKVIPYTHHRPLKMTSFFPLCPGNKRYRLPKKSI